MSTFRDAVDAFLLAPKTLAGDASFEPSPDHSLEMHAMWLIEYGGMTGPHRMKIIAKPYTEWRGFTIIVTYSFLGTEVPITRLNVDDVAHVHHNRGERPTHLPPAVAGNRAYLWPDNRHKFRPTDVGLPYCEPLEKKHETLENAVRYVAGKANVTLDSITVPSYPKPFTLV